MNYHEQLESLQPAELIGSVVRTEGLVAAVAGFPAPVGATVEIHADYGPPIPAEVVAFRNEQTLVYPFADMRGVRHGNRVRLKTTNRYLRVGEGLLGRIIDAHGDIIDGRPQPGRPGRAALNARPPKAVDRPRISTSLTTGIRAIDGMLTAGQGQRIGIFAGSGVGKSVALGMMARHTEADINVIALIGERGREVNDFIERDLGPAGLAKSVVVVATSDEPALMRVQAAMAATSVAEFFRSLGLNVLLIMDSLTRFAMAQREIGLAANEPPTTRGYPPSVFALLPKLVERAGRDRQGSITAFYSVLVEGDDMEEPVADTVRGLLDGHVVLSRELASRGHYPAIDVLSSISRVMPEVVSKQHQAAALKIRRCLGVYQQHADLISIGAYRAGSNAQVDVAIAVHDKINHFLRQNTDESCTVSSAQDTMLRLAAKIPN